jgi:iron complex transport system ATP-binding protein
VSEAPVVLAFDRVSASAGGRPILHGVTLALHAGEVLTLAGPNGAGKTTLFRVASRVLRPSQGSVSLLGRPLETFPRRELARALAVVPQDASNAFPFRVGEMVLMGRSPHLGPLGFETEADLKLAREAMARVGIGSLADRSVLELSGGERQLVLLARALAQDPRVLLLDEPTAHLDLRHRVRVAALVRELAREGRGALVVSHDLGLAARSGDRIALLRQGELLAVGTPREVLTPAHLRAAFEVETEILAAADGSLLVVPKPPSGC